MSQRWKGKPTSEGGADGLSGATAVSSQAITQSALIAEVGLEGYAMGALIGYATWMLTLAAAYFALVGAGNPVTMVDLVFLLNQNRASSASGCAAAIRSGTLSTRVTTNRPPCGAARVRLARLAHPLRPGQGRRDPDLASPGRRPPAPGQDPEAVLGRPGGAGRTGPAAARQAAPPVAADRLPTDPAALARRHCPPALALPAPRSGKAEPRISHP